MAADPSQFGAAEWGILGFIVVALLSAIGVLWRQGNRDRRQAAAAIAALNAALAATIEAMRTEAAEAADEHKAEMLALIERERAASDKHVEKYQQMAERMVSVLDAFSRRLERKTRQRTERGGGDTS